MRQFDSYFMENDEESIRLDVKTDYEAVRLQAQWCGLKPGMRVLDLGCGSGKVTSILHSMVTPGGSVVGIDCSEERLSYAKEHYGSGEGIEFLRRNLKKPMEGLGTFDMIWVRFILEYFRRESFEIVRQLRPLIKPGGYLCLIDLDSNCLNHHELPEAMTELLIKLSERLDEEFNFDSYAGRKLYSYLYDEKYENIELDIRAHHLIYGDAPHSDIFNWTKKIEISTKKMKDLFSSYPGGAGAFRKDFRKYFLDPRRFIYTPLIMAKGTKPLGG